MPFLFSCPHCQTKTQVEDRYSGRSGECVNCGRAIQIPAFATASSTTAPQSAPNRAGWIIAATVVLVILGCFVFAVYQFGGDTIQRLSNNKTQNASMRNLQKIAKALNAYASEHGKYPPPALIDPTTKQPTLSWRVLILPQLGEKDLFEKFNLTQGWDSQENMAASYQMPSVFRHPSSQPYAYDADYFLIVGKNTLFPPEGPLDPKDIIDSPSQTILVCEGKPSNVSQMWTQPIDMQFAKMSGQINGSAQDDPGQLLDDGVAMATVDGRSHFLADTTAVTTFNALVTPDGGEPLPDDTLD